MRRNPASQEDLCNIPDQCGLSEAARLFLDASDHLDDAVRGADETRAEEEQVAACSRVSEAGLKPRPLAGRDKRLTVVEVGSGQLSPDEAGVVLFLGGPTCVQFSFSVRMKWGQTWRALCF